MTGNEDQVGGWDIICRGTPIKMNNNCMYKTRLGSFNNREKQLKQLAKQTASRLANLYMQKKKGVSGNNNYSSNISSSASSNKELKRNNNRNYSNANKPYISKRDK